MDKNILEQAAAAYIEHRCQKHLAEIVEAGTRLVYYFAHLYGHDSPGEDLVQAGYEGLIKAAYRFDPKRGVAFATYAGHCIMGEIRHYVRKESSFRCPLWAAEIQKKVNTFIDTYLQEEEEPPSLEEIAEAINVRAEGIGQAMRAGLVSLEEVDASKIRSRYYETFRLPIEDRIVLEQSLAKLSDVQQKVINLIFYRDMTQTEVASSLGIKQRKVSRILHKSLEKLSKYIS